MKSVQRILFVATIVLLFAGCQQDIVTNPPGVPPPPTPATMQFDAERAAAELLSACAWEIEPGVEVPALPSGPEASRHTLTLLGSTDIQIVTASLRPPEQVNQDFGHIDWLTSPLAASLMWQPLADWIDTHEGRDVD